jgi:hypothetical protein
MKHKVLFLLVISMIAAACSAPAGSSEEAIRAWLDQGQRAAEERDRRALLDMVSERYVDRRGNSREDIGNILRALFLRHGSVTLLVRVEALEIFGETAAEVTLTVAMAGERLSVDAKRFVLELERPDGEWKLIAARWGDLNDTL